MSSLCELDVDEHDASRLLPLGDLFQRILFRLKSSASLSLNALVSPLWGIGLLCVGV